MCVTDFRTLKYMKQKLTTEIDKATILAGDFNSPLPAIDRTGRQKIGKDRENLNTINQFDLTRR